jgi:Transcriptional regulator, AbiEi antitoxin/AbiEi antitoxin C-terminal domain
MKSMNTPRRRPETRQAVSSWLAHHDGVIGREQALRLGLSNHQISHLVSSGDWLVVYRGVYRAAVGAWTPRTALQAALTFIGPGAVASHLSAAWLLGMTDAPPAKATLTVPPNRVVRAGGLRAVRSSHPVQPVDRGGFPCTPPVRTLVDCAGWVSGHQLDELVDRAIARRVVRADALIREPQPCGGTTGASRCNAAWRRAV